jgi:predicted component of type VI protein secretion system
MDAKFANSADFRIQSHVITDTLVTHEPRLQMSKCPVNVRVYTYTHHVTVILVFGLPILTNGYISTT